MYNLGFVLVFSGTWRKAANVLTTTTLLWSKNRLMFIVVLTTLLAKQHAVTYITHLRDHLWFKSVMLLVFIVEVMRVCFFVSELLPLSFRS